MSCFTCGSDSCLSLPDNSRCADGLSVESSWTNALPEAASYKVVWEFNGRPFEKIFAVASGAEVIVPDVLQHGSVIDFYVLDPEGEKLVKTQDSVDYTCFKVKVSSAFDA